MANKQDTLKQVQNTLDKAENIKQRFSNSLQQSKDDAEQLLQEVQDLDKQAHDIFTGYAMGDFDLSAYQDAKKKADEKREMLHASQQKINSIDALQQQELAKVYAEFEDNTKASFQEVKNKEEDKRLKQLEEANQRYLEEVVSISNQHRELYEVEKQLEYLKVDAGLAKNVYSEFMPPFINDIGLYISNDSHNIGTGELWWAYRNGESNVSRF